jgi:protein-disulfide isomerase
MENEKNNSQNSNQNFLAISILIAAFLISGSILYSKNGSSNQARNANQNNPQLAKIGGGPNENPNPSSANLSDVLKITKDDVILGDPKAPVTIIEYSDYQCPFCKRFFDETELQLRKEYIETGKVKMIYRDFPLPGHPYAMPAAEAANCAKDQGKFWAYHDLIFKNQNNLATIDYLKLAEELKMNVSEFKNCLDSKKYTQKIQNDYNLGSKIGVDGTPTFFVNGKQIVGAQPYYAFKSVIDQELNK